MTTTKLAVATVDRIHHADSPTAGIQEAVNSLPPGGGTVFVPRGTYPVRRSILLPCGVTLRGEGAATVLARPPFVLFELTDPAPAKPVMAELSTADGLRTGDEIYIADQAQGGWHARHIVIDAIEGRQVRGTLAAGDPKRSYHPDLAARGGNFFPMILIFESHDVLVTDLLIDGGPEPCDPKRMPGFTCSAIHGVRANNLRVRGVTVRRWPCDGISAQNGSALVTECVVEDCLGHGYHPGSGIAHSIWTNNIGRRNGGDGFFFCRGVRHAVVANNLFLDNRMHGIGNLSDPDAYNVVTSNVVARNGKHGIEGFEALGNVIVGNLIQDNSQAEAGRYAGMRMECHANNVVTGNNCLTTQSPPTQTAGIELVDPAGANLIARNSGPLVEVPVTDSLPAGEIRPARTAPAMDGRLQDPVWLTAEELLLARRVDDGAPATVVAGVRFLYDAQFLYIGAQCPEPRMESVRDRVTERNGGVFAENCIEIYFMPDAGGTCCYHLAVNSLGAVFTRQLGASRAADWDSGARAAAARDHAGWSLELAVPLAAFGPAGLPDGRVCKANIYRTRMTVDPPERSAWSPTRAAFFMPRRFGRLTVAGHGSQGGLL